MGVVHLIISVFHWSNGDTLLLTELEKINTLKSNGWTQAAYAQEVQHLTQRHYIQMEQSFTQEKTSLSVATQP